MKDQILRGLDPQYGFLIHEMSGRQHADVSALVMDIENSVALQAHIRSRESKVSVSGGFRGASLSASRITCFHCHQVGHRQMECPHVRWAGGESRMRQQQQASVVYQSRGQSGTSGGGSQPVAAFRQTETATAVQTTGQKQQPNGGVICYSCKEVMWLATVRKPLLNVQR